MRGDCDKSEMRSTAFYVVLKTMLSHCHRLHAHNLYSLLWSILFLTTCLSCKLYFYAFALRLVFLGSIRNAFSPPLLRHKCKYFQTPLERQSKAFLLFLVHNREAKFQSAGYTLPWFVMFPDFAELFAQATFGKVAE